MFAVTRKILATRAIIAGIVGCSTFLSSIATSVQRAIAQSDADPVVTYYPNGKMRTKTIDNAEVNRFEQYNDDGTIYSLSIRRPDNSKLQTFYNRDGNVSSTETADGKGGWSKEHYTYDNDGSQVVERT